MNSFTAVNSLRSGFSAATNSLTTLSALSSLCSRSTTRSLAVSSATRSLSSICVPSRIALLPPSVTRRTVRSDALQRHEVRIRLPGTRTLKVFGQRVIVHYVDLPPNYSDEVGLPFRSTDLSDAEVKAVFGNGIDAAGANRLLKILHGRRVAGTLDDPALQPTISQFTQSQEDAALKYLRTSVSVDEVINAGLRAEDELAAIEQGSEVGGKDDPNKELGYTSRLRLYSDKKRDGSDPYGEGAFDRIRARNKAKREADLKRREEEQRKKDEEMAKLNPGGLQTIDNTKIRLPEPSERMKTYLAAATSDLQEPPKMAKWERLLPSTIVVLLAVGAVVGLAEFYVPPMHADRIYPDIPPAAATVGALIAANVAVALLWRVPPLWGMMNKYFLLVPATPRPLSIFGAMFSHQKLTHLVPNMLFLWFFGVRLHDEVGRANFLAAYVASGSIGFLGTMYSLVLRNQLHLCTLGASGAIYGIISAYFWLHRYESFKVLGLPPDPWNGIQGLGFIGLMIAINLVGIRAREHTMDIASHIAGLGTGLLAGHLLEKKMKAKTELREQNQTNMGVADKIIHKKDV